MKARSTAIQGALAVIGLVAAYLTWQRPKETVTTERVTVVSSSKQSLEKARSEDGTKFVELSRENGDEPTFWVTQGYLPGKDPALKPLPPQPVFDAGTLLPDGGLEDGGVPPAPPPAPKPIDPTPVRVMRGGERAKEMFDKLTPFEATRSLGVLPDEKLKEVGLTETERTMSVTVAGVTSTFKVAKPMAGMFGWYLRNEQSKEVFLLEGSLLSDMDPTGQVMVDRRIHAFKLNEFDAFTLAIADKKNEYVHSAPDNIGQTVRIAPKSSPDAPDELIKNWHDKVFSRVVVTEVLGKDELPRKGEPVVGLRLEYSYKGKPKGWLEIGYDSAKVPWVRSENTAGWVGVPASIDEAVIEARRFLGVPQP